MRVILCGFFDNFPGPSIQILKLLISQQRIISGPRICLSFVCIYGYVNIYHQDLAKQKKYFVAWMIALNRLLMSCKDHSKVINTFFFFFLGGMEKKKDFWLLTNRNPKGKH